MLVAAMVYVSAVLALLCLTIHAPSRFAPLAAEQWAPLFDAVWLHGAALLGLGACCLVMRRRSECRPASPKFLTVVSIFAGVLSVDRLLNIAFPAPEPRQGVLDLHVGRGWTNRPDSFGKLGATMVRMDSRGLRVCEKQAEVPSPDAMRILFLGDSITLGYDFPARASYGEQTVRLLNERYPSLNWHALNGGTCGYDTGQEQHWLENEGLRLRPNRLVVQFCLNDVSAQYDPACGRDSRRHIEFAESLQPRSFGGIHRAVQALGHFLRDGTDLHQAATQSEHFSLSALWRSPQPEYLRQAWEVAFGHLSAIAARCRMDDIPMVVVCFPIRMQLAANGEAVCPQKPLEDFCRQQSISYLNLAPTYQRAMLDNNGGVELVMIDETHPTPFGHRLAAVALAGLLEEIGWIAPLTKMDPATATSARQAAGIAN